ncbi:hypothetical protein [Streptacidiphilus sp. P02-A3a]|uniref:hypothetical protein n=1 Tax=Streptacidiphilus sp. P02-A3a TaxID=2704468 RepID=UPI0015FD55A2|nr:hypothetical protein [Streptacidiphilus sp. P02-A3a]QMU70633.1 hypothetical protein GXP74_22950 [Streptacidiphilus sp. P02-A3a]
MSHLVPVGHQLCPRATGGAQLCFMVINIPAQFRVELTSEEFGRMFNGHEARASSAHLVPRGDLDEDAPAAVTGLVAELPPCGRERQRAQGPAARPLGVVSGRHWGGVVNS